MKKLVSVILVLVMLCTTCAFAEGYSMRIKDVLAVVNEMIVMDLSNVGLGLDVYSEGEKSGTRLVIEAAEQPVLALSIGVDDEKILAEMTNVSDVYSVDLAALEQMIPAEAMDIVENKDVSAVIKPEDQAALAMLGVKAMGVLAAGVSVAEDQDIEGDIYDVTSIILSNEAIKPLLDELVTILEPYSYLLADQGIESISALYNELNPVLSFEGYVYEAEGIVILDAVLGGGVGGQEMGALYAYIENLATAEGSVEGYAEVGVMDAENDYMLVLNYSGAADDGSWIPAADGEAVDLMAAIQDEAATQKLMAQLTASAMGALAELAAANETIAAMMASMV